jgi:hypothetical protein
MALSKEQEDKYIDELAEMLDTPEGTEVIWPECEECEEEVPGTVYNIRHEMVLCTDCKELLDATWG